MDFVCRRSRFSPEDAEDFRQEVLLKLIDDDYRVLRERIGSSLRGYLKVVILRAGQDYRNRIWGKFRDRTEAKRLGKVALQMERLLRLDGLTFEEAKATLRISFKVDLTDEQFDAIRVRLPPLDRRQFLPIDTIFSMPISASNPEEAHEARAAAQRQQDILRRLDAAVGDLPAEPQLLLRLHYGEGMTIADIARNLGIPQKPLYAEKIRGLAALKKRLEAEGVRKEDLAEIFRQLKGPDGPDGPEEVN